MTFFAALKQTNIRFAGKPFDGAVAERRCNNDLNKLLIQDGRCDLVLNQFVKSDNAAEARNRVGGKRILIGLGIVFPGSYATGVCVFDDDTGRLLAELANTFQCRIRIIDIVVGKLFALELFGSSDASRLNAGLCIKPGCLVWVLYRVRR